MKKIILIFLMLLAGIANAQVPTPNPCGQSRCVNETVVYGENPIDVNANYTFSISPSTTNSVISNGTQLQVTFGSPGSYTITVTKEIAGCPPVTSTCEIIVNPLQIPTITTVIVCEGSPSATMTSSLPGTFTGTGVTGTTFNPNGLTSGQYQVTFIAANGTCIDTTPITGNNEITPGPSAPVIGSN
jgi:hypothetical protein